MNSDITLPDKCKICDYQCNIIDNLEEFEKIVNPDLIDKYCPLNIGRKDKKFFIMGEYK